MADRLAFNLVTPEKLLRSTEADMVTVPGVEGDFGVMVEHSPLMSVLRAGMIYVENDKQRAGYFVRGGFADVTPKGLTILAEHALPLEGLTAATLDAEIQMVKDTAEATRAAGENQTADENQIAEASKAKAEELIAALEELRATL